MSDNCVIVMRGAHNYGRYAVTLGLLLLCPCAFALDPALDVSQYSHTAWTVREGFFKGGITAVTQTPDGYLWLGTEFGLLLFDGVKAIPWRPPENQHLPASNIYSLLAASDGTLWIGTWSGLVSLKDGRLTEYPELAGQIIMRLLEDREGTIWASGRALPFGRLCAIQKGRIRCHGEDGSLGDGVISLYEDSKGNLWSGVQRGLWRWRPGPPKFYTVPGEPDGVLGLGEDEDGTLLIGMRGGIRRWVDGKTEAYRPADTLPRFSTAKMLRDRDGALWIATADRGLVHVHKGRTDLFAKPDSLSGDYVTSLFEDREGSIWAATRNGLDRFRNYAIATFSVNQGLSNALVTSVLADQERSVWLGTYGGLNRWNNGRIEIHRSGVARDGKLNGLPPNSLFQDNSGRIWVSTPREFGYLENGRFIAINGIPGQFVNSIVEDTGGNLWIANQQFGLFVRSRGGLIRRIPWAELGHKDPAWALAADPFDGGIWLGFFQGGVAKLSDGQIRKSYVAADGLGGGRVHDLRFDSQGALWAATEGGLSRLKQGSIATLTSKNGLPCDAVHWAIEDDVHSLWLYMACGVARIAGAELDAWVAAADIHEDGTRRIQVTVFDSSDGVISRASPNAYSPRIAKDKDGRLWFPNSDGVSVVDPRHLPVNQLAPPVHIEQVIADREDVTGLSRLPPLVRDLQINYTSLSLVAAEKVRFRYRLEGHDLDWIDAGTRRQVFYNDLAPRHYRFRVMACNNSGVWNESGASFDFSIAPAYYQTNLFRFVVVFAVLSVLAGLYQLRQRQMAGHFHIRMEGQVAERTRIARELHDTLLQSFQGVLLKFSTIKYLMRDRPDEAEEMLERMIEQGRAAITEGRDAVQGLRSSMVVANDLARAITTFGGGLTADQPKQNCPEFRVQVEGKSRDMPPLVQDEVYRIACEALHNAFRHAQAKRIEVQIRYEQRLFRLGVFDNGKGIDPAILSEKGREGHHGLPGLNERAQLVGGKLSVWSQLNSGTEIGLTIPAAIAYTKSAPARSSVSAGEETG